MMMRLIDRILEAANVRVLTTNYEGRIGHVAMETMCFAKENALREEGRCTGILALDGSIAANPELIRLLKGARRYGLHVISDGIAARLLRWLVRRGLAVKDMSDYSVAINDTSRYYGIERDWEAAGGGAFLEFGVEDVARGRAGLGKLGIPGDAWYVCVHCRTAGYAPEDDALHAFRNAEIENYIRAMKAVVAKGGWCVRMGDPTMPKLGAIEGVVDYAHSEHRTPFMDIYLTGSCRFFLGNTSGLILVANAFGRKLVWTNLIPMSVYPSPGAIGIPKLIHCERLGRLLTFAEVMGTRAADCRLGWEYEELGLRVLDNTGEEIEALTVEALARAEGESVETTEEDEAMQAKVLGLLRPGHYSHGTNGRFGRDFLRRHRVLTEGGAAEAERLESVMEETKAENWARVNRVLARKEEKLAKLQGRVKKLQQRLGEFRKMRDLVKAAAARHGEIGTVIDVGAAVADWSTMCLEFLPEARYLLFEAQPVHREALEAFEAAHANAACVYAACGPKRGTIQFDVTGALQGQASFERFAENNLEVPMRSIDGEVTERGLTGPFLIKTDTHGFEVPILEGAEETLKETSVVIMECYNWEIAPDCLLFDEMCRHMRERGFRCVDATSPHRVEGAEENFWIDLVFERIAAEAG